MPTCGAQWRNGTAHAKVRGTGPRAQAHEQSKVAAQHKQGSTIIATDNGAGDVKRQEQHQALLQARNQARQGGGNAIQQRGARGRNIVLQPSNNAIIMGNGPAPAQQSAGVRAAAAAGVVVPSLADLELEDEEEDKKEKEAGAASPTANVGDIDE
jgi:hypothetical protein